jgi:hypothetical protein
MPGGYGCAALTKQPTLGAAAHTGPEHAPRESVLPRGLEAPCAKRCAVESWVLLTLEQVFDMNVWGRDRDRAIERSPGLELLDEFLCALVKNSLHSELQAHGVE